MSSPTFLQRIADTADEIMCRISNGKVHLFTELGKRMLPEGHWGHAPGELDQPYLYLTFDDGPHPDTTPRLLELLEEQGVKATFFLVGSNCERYPELVRAIHEAGHTVGNHTFNHLLMPLLANQQLRSEIVGTNDVIESIIGCRPAVFRPPFGMMDGRAAAYLKEEGMVPVYWGSAPEDWLIPGSHRIIRRVMWKIADGTLIVLHEGAHLAEQTATAASEIISRCKTLGYQFSKVEVRA